MSFLEAVLTIAGALGLWGWAWWWQGRSEAGDVTVDALEFDGPLGQIDARLTRDDPAVGVPSRPQRRTGAPREHGLVVQGILWLWRVAAVIGGIMVLAVETGGGPPWPALVPLLLWAVAAAIALWLEAQA